MRTLAALSICFSFAAHAAGAPARERIAVVVGADEGTPDEEPLRYAASDARRFRSVLTELGDVHPERALLLLGGGPDGVLRALTEARGRAAELAGAGARVELLFYFSGHGDDESLHLPGGALALSTLRAAIDDVPADLRLVIIDACRGPHLKGTHPGPAFVLAPGPDAPRGSVELRASSAGEAAQESDELGGAVFTHFLISGLRGAADADGDGRVTLGELYGYVYRRTLLHTGAAAVVQHPAESVDLRGAGEVALTFPRQASAALRMPSSGAQYLVFATPGASVMGELDGSQGALSLPAGQYVVERRQGQARGIAHVDLSWGGSQSLSDADFRAVAREEWVARGGSFELRSWHVSAETGVEFSPNAAEGIAGRAGVALDRAWGEFLAELDASFVDGTAATVGFSGNERSAAVGAGFGRRLFLSRVTLVGTLGLEGRLSYERLTRDDAARAGAAGLASTDAMSFGALGPRASLEASVPLGHHLVATVRARAAALFRDETGANGTSIAVHPVFELSAGAGYAF